MPRRQQMNCSGEASIFHKVRHYSRCDVETVNVGAYLLEKRSSWKKWIEETLCDLLEVSQGLHLSLVCSSELQSGEDKTYSFRQNTITIGRASENDISLPLRSVSRQHAQIIQRNGEYFLEDLASVGGTYVNHQRLQPRQSKQLRSGDQFVISPYVFQVTVQDLWAQETGVSLAFSSRLSPGAVSTFVTALGSDSCLFQIALHPDLGQAILVLSRAFLTTILSRTVREISPVLVAGDAGVFEFVVVSILERANRELHFPFQCSLEPNNRFAPHDEYGLICEATLKLKDFHGFLSLFLPGTCLRNIRKTKASSLPKAMREQLSWKLSVRLGFTILRLRDVENLDLGDTLLYTEQAQIVLPKIAPERGWHVNWSKDDPSRLTVTRCFEGGALMEENLNQQEEIEATSDITVDSLPVRVNVVLHEIEFSLRELEGLREGSIVEIGDIPEQVQLVVNGKVFGAGELVRVEDQLGVQITRWGKS